MSDEFKATVSILASLFGISFMAAVARSILSTDRRSIGGFLRGLTLALFVGCIVGALIQDYQFSAPTQGAIVGICAFVADDILLILLSVTTKLRERPRIIIDYFINRTGGGSGGNNYDPPSSNDRRGGGGGYGI